MSPSLWNQLCLRPRTRNRWTVQHLILWHPLHILLCHLPNRIPGFLLRTATSIICLYCRISFMDECGFLPSLFRRVPFSVLSQDVQPSWVTGKLVPFGSNSAPADKPNKGKVALCQTAKAKAPGLTRVGIIGMLRRLFGQRALMKHRCRRWRCNSMITTMTTMPLNPRWSCLRSLRERFTNACGECFGPGTTAVTWSLKVLFASTRT